MAFALDASLLIFPGIWFLWTAFLGLVTSAPLWFRAARRPPRVSRALFSLFASVIPVGLARKFLLRSSLPRITVPFPMLFKLPRALWLLHEPLPSRFTFPSFLPSLSLYFFLLHLLCSSCLPLTHLHLPSRPFPGCLSPGWRQQRVVLSRV